jgi:hypothetical protein
MLHWSNKLETQNLTTEFSTEEEEEEEDTALKLTSCNTSTPCTVVSACMRRIRLGGLRSPDVGKVRLETWSGCWMQARQLREELKAATNQNDTLRMELQHRTIGAYEQPTNGHDADVPKAKLAQALADRDATVAAQAATIAEMRQAQEGLRQQQEQLSGLLESSHNSVCVEPSR